MCHTLYVVYNEGPPFFFFQLSNLCLGLKKLKVLLLVCTAVSKYHLRFFTNRLKSPVGILYKLNIIDLGYLVSSSMAQISKSSSLHLHEILILLKHTSLQTTIHTPPFCRFLLAET